jgi:hypothetical protein
MSSKIYLGVRFPPKYERLTLKNIDLNSLNIESLQAETSKYMELPESGIGKLQSEFSIIFIVSAP